MARRRQNGPWAASSLAEVNQLLEEADGDLEHKRWPEAIEKTMGC